MEDFGKLFCRLGNATRQGMDAMLEQFDITLAQVIVLRFVDECECPPCSRDVEERLGLSHATVAGLLNRLEKKKYLRLETDASDRRCRRIFCCQRAVDSLAFINAQVCRTESQILEGFTEAEKLQFQDFLLRAVRNLNAGEEKNITGGM